MSNRVVAGAARSAFGIWASQPGFDVLTASALQLNLDMATNACQILQRGHLSALPQTVVLGLTRVPFINLWGITTDPTVHVPLLARPWPSTFDTTPSTAAVSDSGASMLVSSPIACYYIVFRQATS